MRTTAVRIKCSRCKRETVANVDPQTGDPVLEKWGCLKVVPISDPRAVAWLFGDGDMCPRCVDALKNWMQLKSPSGAPLDCAVEGCEKPNIGRGHWCIDHNVGDGDS